MDFVTVPLLLLVVSLYTLMALYSYDKERIAILNSYWEMITLGIFALLILLGLIYFTVSIGFLLENLSLMKLLMKGVIVMSIPIVIVVLYGVKSKVGFFVVPNGSFLDVLTYISIYWLLIYHLEGLMDTGRIMGYLALLILIISLLMFTTSLLLMRYRKLMKRHMMQPLDMIEALKGIIVTFTLIAIAGLSANFGLLFTHIMSDLAGALIVLIVLTRLLTELRVYIRG